jgi:hypothetical protein
LQLYTEVLEEQAAFILTSGPEDGGMYLRNVIQDISTLNMEATRSSETLVPIITTTNLPTFSFVISMVDVKTDTSRNFWIN